MDGVELGQVSSYVTRIKWVDPSGELRDAFEATTPSSCASSGRATGCAGGLRGDPAGEAVGDRQVRLPGPRHLQAHPAARRRRHSRQRDDGGLDHRRHHRSPDAKSDNPPKEVVAGSGAALGLDVLRRVDRSQPSLRPHAGPAEPVGTPVAGDAEARLPSPQRHRRLLPVRPRQDHELQGDPSFGQVCLHLLGLPSAHMGREPQGLRRVQRGPLPPLRLPLQHAPGLLLHQGGRGVAPVLHPRRRHPLARPHPLLSRGGRGAVVPLSPGVQRLGPPAWGHPPVEPEPLRRAGARRRRLRGAMEALLRLGAGGRPAGPHAQRVLRRPPME